MSFHACPPISRRPLKTVCSRVRIFPQDAVELCSKVQGKRGQYLKQLTTQAAVRLLVRL